MLASGPDNLLFWQCDVMPNNDVSGYNKQFERKVINMSNYFWYLYYC